MDNNPSQPEPAVVHNAEQSRFEVSLAGQTAVLEYEIDDKHMLITHTEVPEAFGGQGIGSRLMHAALEHARAQGLRAVPLCEFAEGYLARHPEYNDMVDNPQV